MSSETTEISNLIQRFEREWKVSTEPVCWGYPQLLREVACTFADFDFDEMVIKFDQRVRTDIF